MVHYLSVVLILWGLIAQPLPAVLPGETPGQGDRTEVRDDTAMPCHPQAGHDAPTPCPQCPSDHGGAGCLLVNHCSSSCSVSAAPGAVASSGGVHLIDRGSCNQFIAASDALLARLPARIFHPPKAA